VVWTLAFPVPDVMAARDYLFFFDATRFFFWAYFLIVLPLSLAVNGKVIESSFCV